MTNHRSISLGSIAKITSGGTPDRKKPSYWNGPIPWVKTSQIQHGTITADDIEEWITEEGLKKSSAKIIPTGTILMAMYGQGKTRGQVAILGIDAAINQACAAITIPSDIDRDYVYQQLCFRYESIRALSNTGSQENLNADLIREITFPLPIIQEQNAIAYQLKLWDRAIGLTERLLAEKRLRRKGLMQQLLTGKRRLPGFNSPWVSLKLRDIVAPVQRQVPKPTHPYDALGIRSHFKGTFAKQVEDPATVDMEMLFIARTGDLIVNITFAWEGAIAIVPPEHDGRLVSHRFPTYRPKEQIVPTAYLSYLVSQEKFRYLLADISPGGAGRNRVMSKKDFLKLEVTVPGLAEQRKIAEMLDTASREIDLLQTKADALREQKKGLMQQLLTGKKRVKVATS